MGHRDRFERIASSGCVFSEKPAVAGNSKNSFQLNAILLRLIEEEIELTFRSQKCLNNAGIKLIGQLVQKSASELFALKNFGRRSLCEIEKILTEIGLTLEMTLDFSPWIGDSNGTELIKILSLQRVRGGFHIDHEAANILSIDFEKMNQEVRDSIVADKRIKLPVLYTKHILHRLETEFEKGRPYLTNLIKRHRIWLQKELKKENFK